MWNAKERYKTAETFLDHQWLRVQARASPASLWGNLVIPPSSNQINSHIQSISNIQSDCYLKMRDKSSFGTRRWQRKWSVTRGGTILFYRTMDEDRVENQHLAKAIELRDKQVLVFAASTHNFTLGIQDVNLQQIVLWLRYDNEEDFLK